MFYNTQDLLWRRKLEEQADLQQAIELQSRRLMGLQLLDVKRNSHHQRAFSTGAAVSPPMHSPNFFNQTVLHSSGPNSPELTEGMCVCIWLLALKMRIFNHIIYVIFTLIEVLRVLFWLLVMVFSS